MKRLLCLLTPGNNRGDATDSIGQSIEIWFLLLLVDETLTHVYDQNF